MLKADSASVSWDPQKKLWRVRIQVGEEVINRPASGGKLSRDSAHDVLRSTAIEIALEDGYAVDAAAVSIMR